MHPTAPAQTVAGAVGVPALAGGSPEAEESAPAADPQVEALSDFDTEEPLRSKIQPEIAFVAVAAGLATLALGIVPGPLFNLVRDAGEALGNLL
jgi:hypothetical protein